MKRVRTKAKMKTIVFVFLWKSQEERKEGRWRGREEWKRKRGREK